MVNSKKNKNKKNRLQRWHEKEMKTHYMKEPRAVTFEQVVLICMFALFNALDYFLTIFGLQKGMEEQNPVADHLLQNNPFMAFYLKFLIFGVITVFLVTNMRHLRREIDYNIARGALVVITLTFMMVCFNNLFQMII